GACKQTRKRGNVREQTRSYARADEAECLDRRERAYNQGPTGNRRSCCGQGQGVRQTTASVLDTLPSAAAALEQEQGPPPAPVVDTVSIASVHGGAPANTLL
ncbi:unnamed protein product, partial [Pylaiella littoralis]